MDYRDDIPIFLRRVPIHFNYLIEEFGFNSQVDNSTNSSSRYSYEKDNVRVEIGFYYRNSSVKIEIYKKTSEGIFADPNDWKHCVMLYHLILRENKNFNVENLYPHDLAMESIIELNAKLLREYATNIINEKEWISTEDVIGKPPDKKDIKINVYYKYPSSNKNVN